MCTMLVYAHLFVYCRQDNGVRLTLDNRVSRLIGPSDASPDVTRLSEIYCIYLRQVETNRLTKLTLQLTRTDCNKKTLCTLS